MLKTPLPYQLLDSGEGRKLELVGDILIDRQSPTAVWKQHLPKTEWKKAMAVHHRSEKGEGRWEYRQKVLESWNTLHGKLKLKCKLTGFGHLGFFAEVADQWAWMRNEIPRLNEKKNSQIKLLNLFGYTGGSSISSALAGAHVTHVDAAHGVVDWGKEIATANEVPADSIRWIVDDCLVFVKREIRREKKYDGFIMDPPSFGRGPKKEVWKIEEHILELLEALKLISEKQLSLLHFSSHTPGFTPEVLKNLVQDHFEVAEMKLEQGEMLIPESGKRTRSLPSGTFVRATRI